MFTKLALLIALGATLSFGTPVGADAQKEAATEATALFRICLGPMTLGLMKKGGPAMHVSFDAASHNDGHAALVHTHISPALNPFRMHPLTREHAQTLPSLLPTLP
jgi:hypothetical protein